MSGLILPPRGSLLGPGEERTLSAWIGARQREMRHLASAGAFNALYAYPSVKQLRRKARRS